MRTDCRASAGESPGGEDGEAALWDNAAGTRRHGKPRPWVSLEKQWEAPDGFSRDEMIHVWFINISIFLSV